MTDDFRSTGIGKTWSIKDRELHVDTPTIMGILNVTPDSFSDGGRYLDLSQAVSKAKAMLNSGAAIIDIGGESTRPGSLPVKTEDELDRVIPVIEALAESTDAIISIDTQKAPVAEAAVKSGAHIVNDISAGLSDPGMLPLMRTLDSGYVLMHMQGSPETMQNNPSYDNVSQEVMKFLSERLQASIQAGIDANRIVIDPGIGFGKSLEDNLTLIANIDSYSTLGRPVLLGASRKSFIGMIDGSSSNHRLGGSLASVLAAYSKGVRLFRVHDVAETRQVLDIFTAIQKHSV